MISVFHERAAELQSRIAAACNRVNRNPSEVRLVWVSKNHPQEQLIEAQAVGAKIFGENRVQEVLEKFPLPPVNPITGQPLDYELHLIGHLQSNKIRKVLPLCTAIHSIDSPELWQSVDRVAGELNLKRDVFLQVNTSREPKKSGFSTDGFLEAVETLPMVSHLRLVGLMTMGPVDGNPGVTRACFRELRELLKSLQESAVLGARFPRMPDFFPWACPGILKLQ